MARCSLRGRLAGHLLTFCVSQVAQATAEDHERFRVDRPFYDQQNWKVTCSHLRLGLLIVQFTSAFSLSHTFDGVTCSHFPPGHAVD